MLLALPAAAAEADAPYAEDGDMDYIRSYVVTVDPREDGSVDITYDIDWQVIDGDKTDYLSWVKIGLANSSVDELTPLTDTISDLQYTSDGGSYAKVVFRHRYYAPDVAAANGGESSVHFAFSVHQSHLFTKNDDGTANFAFAPGWFDDLSVENMQVRWHNYDGFVADNTGVDGDYLTWDFGAMGHGQQAMVHVTVPVTNAAAFDPGAAMTTDDYDSGEDLDEIIGMLVTLVVVLLAIAIIIIAIASQSPEWGGGFGGGSRSTASSANAPRRGGDVNSNVTIDFMEACKGVKKKMRITHMVKCDQCNGTGADANTTTSTCTECHGRGSVQVNQRTPFGTVSSTRVCSRCGGKGKIVTNPCSKCRGSGRCRTTSDIELKIPAGIDNGQVLRVGGQGDAGLNGGPSGDLNVSVNVRPHDLFTRRGVDIYCEIPITYAQAVLGDKVTVPTIKGKVEYDIPEGTQSGTKFRLRGEGVKYLGRESYGDQYVTVVVEVPRKLTRQQKELLQKFDDSLEEKNQAKRQSFFEKLKRRFEQQ